MVIFLTEMGLGEGWMMKSLRVRGVLGRRTAKGVLLRSSGEGDLPRERGERSTMEGGDRLPPSGPTSSSALRPSDGCVANIGGDVGGKYLRRSIGLVDSGGGGGYMESPPLF
jgi:hypothetical protein